MLIFHHLQSSPTSKFRAAVDPLVTWYLSAPSAHTKNQISIPFWLTLVLVVVFVFMYCVVSYHVPCVHIKFIELYEIINNEELEHCFEIKQELFF